MGRGPAQAVSSCMTGQQARCRGCQPAKAQCGFPTLPVLNQALDSTGVKTAQPGSHRG